MKSVRMAAIAVSTFTCAALLSFGWSETGGVSLSIDNAQARVGRPLTPVSAAGVARRHYRRSAYGVGVGAGIVGAAAIGTAAAVAATSPYYGPVGYARGPYYGGMGYGPYGAYGYPAQDYATLNGFVCRPGTLVKLEDGLQHICQ